MPDWEASGIFTRTKKRLPCDVCHQGITERVFTLPRCLNLYETIERGLQLASLE